MDTQKFVEAMENIGDDITIKDAICKEIYSENANHGDYSNEEVIAKLKTITENAIINGLNSITIE